REAQVSAQHAVAAVLKRGKAGLAEFSDAYAGDPTLRTVREKVFFTTDESYALESATVIIHTHSAAFAHKIDCARGSSARPLSDSDLEQKLRDLAEYGGSGCDPRPLIAAIGSIDARDEAGASMGLA